MTVTLSYETTEVILAGCLAASFLTVVLAFISPPIAFAVGLPTMGITLIVLAMVALDRLR